MTPRAVVVRVWQLVCEWRDWARTRDEPPINDVHARLRRLLS